MYWLISKTAMCHDIQISAFSDACIFKLLYLLSLAKLSIFPRGVNIASLIPEKLRHELVTVVV